MADMNPEALHRKRKSLSEQDKGFECLICKARFSFRTNLNRHKKTIHKRETAREKRSCTVPGCTAKFYHQTKLLAHLEAAHGASTEKSELRFLTMAEFLSWKAQEEVENFVCFTKQRGDLSHLSVKHQHYICQRDGSARRHTPRKTDRKQRKGVVKTDLACPARMLVRQCRKSGRVDVCYYKSHSHPVSAADTVHHPLPQSVHKEIKQKLEAGVTVNQVYQEFQVCDLDQSMTSARRDRLRSINKPQIRAIQRRLQRKSKVISQEESDVMYNAVAQALEIVGSGRNSHLESKGGNGLEIEEHCATPSSRSSSNLSQQSLVEDCSRLAQEPAFTEPMVGVPLGAPVYNPPPPPIALVSAPPLDYGTKLHSMLSEMLVLMQNENVRKMMLPCIMGNLEHMLALCRQEANSLHIRRDVEIMSLEKPS